MSDEILDIAGGNPRLADQIRELLHTLQDHENAKIREIARDALNGASLRQMAASSVYGDDVGTALDAFWHTYQQMTPEQQAELEKTGREYVSPPETL
jgi:hypothetical protein